MDLHPEEPDLGPWRAVDDAGLLALVGRPSLVLVDGRGGGGKTTFSSRLVGLLGAGLVHTDDIAWEYSRFGWDDLLVGGVIGPWRGGGDVSYRPPGWAAHDRPGALEVAGCEGSLAGAGGPVAGCSPTAREAGPAGSARARAARDAGGGTTYWADWTTEEEPFWPPTGRGARRPGRPRHAAGRGGTWVGTAHGVVEEGALAPVTKPRSGAADLLLGRDGLRPPRPAES